jgi:hypothetical protein
MRRSATTLGLILAGLLVPSIASAVFGIPDCEDGIDNDGDNLIDFPADPGCASPTDTSEVNSPLDAGFPSDLAFDLARPNVPEDLGPSPPTTVLAPPSVVPAGTSGTGQRPVTDGCEMGVMSEGGTIVVVVLAMLVLAAVRRARGSAHRRG